MRKISHFTKNLQLLKKFGHFSIVLKLIPTLQFFFCFTRPDIQSALDEIETLEQRYDEIDGIKSTAGEEQTISLNNEIHSIVPDGLKLPLEKKIST